MSFSYDNTLAEDRDRVRFELSDTDSDDPLVEDEEIDYALTQNSNVLRVAANIAESIAVQLGRRPSVTLAQAGLSAKEQHDHYIQLAKDLRARASSSGGAVFAGGISKADRETREADTDRVQPAFTTDLHTC